MGFHIAFDNVWRASTCLRGIVIGCTGTPLSYPLPGFLSTVSNLDRTTLSAILHWNFGQDVTLLLDLLLQLRKPSSVPSQRRSLPTLSSSRAAPAE